MSNRPTYEPREGATWAVPQQIRRLRQLGTGAVIGTSASGLLLLFGSIGGDGWQPRGASTALSLALIILLVLLLTVTVTVGYGAQLRLRLTKEDYQRRSELLPTLLGIVLPVLAAWLLVGR